ncbi:Nuclear control of ATPase protein 2 [Allomyces javanicus]|nr:Nuclear control of ATPase protein 2 [Allomyces javanicus]
MSFVTDTLQTLSAHLEALTATLAAAHPTLAAAAGDAPQIDDHPAFGTQAMHPMDRRLRDAIAAIHAQLAAIPPAKSVSKRDLDRVARAVRDAAKAHVDADEVAQVVAQSPSSPAGGGSKKKARGSVDSLLPPPPVPASIDAKYAHYEALAWLFLGKAATVAYAGLMSAVLAETLAVQHDAEWWTTTSPAVYLAMTTPSRLAGVLGSPHPLRHLAAARHAGAEWRLVRAVRGAAGSGSWVPWVPAAKTEMRAHATALEKVKVQAAHVLGALYAHVMAGAEVQDGDEEDPVAGVRRHVAELVVRMDVLGHALWTAPPGAAAVGAAAAADAAVPPGVAALSAAGHGVSETLAALQRVLARLTTVPPVWSTAIKTHRRPHAVVRWWLPVATTVVCATVAAQQVQVSWPTIVAAGRAGVEFLQHAVTDYILTPARDVFETVRHREHRLAVMGAKSLASDLASLERMVVEYAATTGTTSVDADAIRAAVRDGDLSVVLTDYEAAIQRPVVNAVAGPLLTLMLIQVQKSKVDLELAMAALDKLLKSNELNFGFLALVPTVVVAWAAAKGISAWFGRRVGRSARAARRVFRQGVWRVDRLLSQHAESEAMRLGLILIEVNWLKNLVPSLGVPSEVQDQLLVDLHDLELATHDKHWVLERIVRLGLPGDE